MRGAGQAVDDSVVVTVKLGPGFKGLTNPTRWREPVVQETQQVRQAQQAQQVRQAQQAQQVRLPAGATVADLLVRLGLSGRSRETSHLQDLLILCNGVRAEGDRRLASGDTVWVFYAMSGG